LLLFLSLSLPLQSRQ